MIAESSITMGWSGSYNEGRMSEAMISVIAIVHWRNIAARVCTLKLTVYNRVIAAGAISSRSQVICTAVVGRTNV